MNIQNIYLFQISSPPPNGQKLVYGHLDRQSTTHKQTPEEDVWKQKDYVKKKDNY